MKCNFNFLGIGKFETGQFYVARYEEKPGHRNSNHSGSHALS